MVIRTSKPVREDLNDNQQKFQSMVGAIFELLGLTYGEAIEALLDLAAKLEAMCE